MLHQRVNFIEDELQSMGIDVPQLMPKKNTHIATSAASPKSPPKRSYGSSVLRRRSIISPSKHVPPRPPILKPVATAMASAAAVAIAASAAAAAAEKDAVKEEKTENGVAADAKSTKDKDENVPALEKTDQAEKPVAVAGDGEEEKDRPPVLEEIKTEPEDDEEMSEEEVEAPTPDDNSKSRPSSSVSNDVKTEVKMEVDDEQMEEEEEEEERVDIDDIEYAVGRYAEKKIRETVGKRKSANVVEEEPQVVTYTTRGRRHTLPRRYAEFTGN